MPDPLVPLAKDWLSKLVKEWARIRADRKAELDRIFLELGDYEQLAKTYIEPDGQTGNPADFDEDEPIPTWETGARRVPMREWVNELLKGETKVRDGRNTLFVLSDAGMGKSSLLIMLKITHLLRFWPDGLDFRLLKLGESTLDEIRAIGARERRRTVLLLDALDEDRTAFGRIEERIEELLREGRSCRQVIVTCRTQFFPRGGEVPIKKEGKVELGGFVCNLLYLSPFTDRQVDEYLRKVYPARLIDRVRKWLTDRDHQRLEDARSVVMPMKSLRMRPMLLAYVEDLMASEIREWREYPVYEALMNGWLLREEREKRSRATREQLWEACQVIALDLQANEKRTLTPAELARLVRSHPDVRHLEAFEFGGRSLLNRTAAGEYRFAHYSIQEFLVAHRLCGRPDRLPPGPIRGTDQILSFLFSWIAESPTERLPAVPWARLDLRDLEMPVPPMSFESLAGAKLMGAYLRGADLRAVDLRKANLRGALLAGADLRGAELSSALLEGTELGGAQLEGATIVGGAVGNLEQSLQEFRRVVDRVEQPELALAALDELRRSVGSHDDPFLLDQAARELASLWPELGAAAQAVCSRLYEYLPAPPEELFRWIETPLDGRVELWREIPAGDFWMGSAESEGHPDERPRHRVTIERPFRIAAVPVTNEQYAAFDPDHKPHRWRGVPAVQLASHPVVNVSWHQAMRFCRWLSASFEWARGARLPTEEEWEFACRAGTETRYWRGDDEKHLDEVGWYAANSGKRTHRVGGKPANPWGLYDVHGNVWEWTLSPSTESYAGREKGVAIDPADVASPAGGHRVVRGGSYRNGADWTRAAYRSRRSPVIRSQVLGFRVVLPPVSAPRAD